MPSLDTTSKVNSCNPHNCTEILLHPLTVNNIYYLARNENGGSSLGSNFQDPIIHKKRRYNHQPRKYSIISLATTTIKNSSKTLTRNYLLQPCLLPTL